MNEVQRVQRQFAILSALFDQVIEAHERGQIDAHQATWLLHHVIRIDERRAVLVRRWNALAR